MSDKLPALPPRPIWSEYMGTYGLTQASFKYAQDQTKHMDAQDARIKELEGWWSKVNIELNAQTVRALEAEIRIAELEAVCKEAGNELSKLMEATTKRISELEREILEAHELLFSMEDDEPCSLDHHGHCQTHGSIESPCHMQAIRNWLIRSRARNAEKEQGS